MRVGRVGEGGVRGRTVMHSSSSVDPPESHTNTYGTCSRTQGANGTASAPPDRSAPASFPRFTLCFCLVTLVFRFYPDALVFASRPPHQRLGPPRRTLNPLFDF